MDHPYPSTDVSLRFEIRMDRGRRGWKDDTSAEAQTHAGTYGMGRGTPQKKSRRQDTGRTGPRYSHRIHMLYQGDWGTDIYSLHFSQEAVAYQHTL